MLAMEMALLRDPSLLLLDEHTASLDQANALKCLRLTERLSKATGVTVVMVTHNFEIIANTDRVVRLVDGRVEVPASSPRIARPGLAEDEHDQGLHQRQALRQG